MAIEIISGSSTDTLTVDATSKAARVTTYDTAGNPIVPASGSDISAATASIGTDGSTPPSIAGTGVRGWLRAIYEAILARWNTLGQKTSAGSTPVVLASDQSTISISGTVTANVGSGTQPVSGTVTANLGTIAGVATETTLSALNTKIPAAVAQDRATAGAPGAVRLSDGSTFYKATTPADTQPVSAASLPLPTGAATESTLSTLNGKIPASPSQEHVSAVSFHAARLTDGSTFYKGTTPSDTQPISASSLPLPTGAATETTLAARLADSTFTGRINTQGQKAMAASTPVVIASDQSAVPTSVASLPLPAGAATETTLGTRLADSTFTGRINTQGQKTMTASTPVVLASDQSALPVTGTFFQATQPVSVASLPLPSGAATEATLATLQAGRAASSSVTSVAALASNATLLANNATRKGATVFNDSLTATLYLKLGATASVSSFTTKLPPGVGYELPVPCYTGTIDGIWDAAIGNARITELT